MPDAPTGHQTGYLRFPSIASDLVVFVTEDDLWSVPAGGGTARRLTADLLSIGRPVLSPGADLVAFTSEAQGQSELYVMPAAGGSARRLTWLGEVAGVLGWTPDGRVLFASATGQPFRPLTFAYAVPPEGTEPATALPYGPVGDVSYGAGGGVVVGRNTSDPARWKRYRGGTAGALWIDREGSGDFTQLLRPETIDGNLASPMWIGDRIYFLSDHEGTGNLYSCSLSGEEISRHTEHWEHYARSAATDGETVVYQVAAQLWRYDVGSGRSDEIEVELASPRTQRQARFVPADRSLAGYVLDEKGARLAVDARGKLFSFAPFDGPVRQLGEAQGVRYRLGHFLGDSGDIVAVSDASGKEAIEVHAAGGGGSADEQQPGARSLDIAGLGRPFELSPSPDGTVVAVTSLQHQLLLVDVASGEGRLLDESAFGRIEDATWSADGRFLAYSYPASRRIRQIKVADVTSGDSVAITEPQFVDGSPSFDPTGKYLYFLSRRTFDPVYDSLFFDLGFPRGTRPYLVTLRADLPSPFLVRPEPSGDDRPKDASTEQSPSDEATNETRTVPSEDQASFSIDFDGITDRIVEVPVAEGRYEGLWALENKLLLLSRPIEGELGRDYFDFGEPPNGTLECYGLVEDHCEALLSQVADVALSGDRKTLAYTTRSPGGRERRLRLVSTAAKPGPEREAEPPGRRSGWVDLGRVRVRVDPAAEWRQMVREAWRLQIEQFWTEDLSGVDWQRVLERYLPLVERVATRSELSDLIWELQGELGTSHCYEMGGDYREKPSWGQAFLGADLERDESGNWLVARVVPGTSWHSGEQSPLTAPGVGVAEGSRILAVNGQLVDEATGPASLLANQAGLPVELTVSAPSDAGAGRRTVVVPTLRDERPLRYRAWVSANRTRVREATGGRVGYLHVPDMMAPGWSEFHRSYQAEMERDALVVDARFNSGGRVSGLVLEKLARRRLGWDVPRRGSPVPYPPESPRGPLVVLTNEWAGSDGDIFTHGFKLLGLGPVVGTRTWGGVIGITPTLPLVDGSLTTQPEFAFWFVDVGWGVENRGVDPDVEVQIRPQDYASGRDPQLDRAIELVVEALEGYHPPGPERDEKPRKTLPDGPPGT